MYKVVQKQIDARRDLIMYHKNTMIELKKLTMEEHDVENLRVVANIFKMKGGWKATKNEIASFLIPLLDEFDMMTKPKYKKFGPKDKLPERNKTEDYVSKEKKKKTHFRIFDEEDEEIFSSEDKYSLYLYCEENKICSTGWIKRSLATGERSIQTFKYKRQVIIKKY